MGKAFEQNHQRWAKMQGKKLTRQEGISVRIDLMEKSKAGGSTLPSYQQTTRIPCPVPLVLKLGDRLSRSPCIALLPDRKCGPGNPPLSRSKNLSKDEVEPAPVVSNLSLADLSSRHRTCDCGGDEGKHLWIT